MGDIDAAVTRLLRNLTIAQLGLTQRPVTKTMVKIQTDALASAIEEVRRCLPEAPVLIQVPDEVMGPHLAAELGRAVSPDVPDTIPEEWN